MVYDLNLSNIESSTNVSVDTLRLTCRKFIKQNSGWINFMILKTLYFSFFFVRFVKSCIGYNLKLLLYYMYWSFAGYLWYRHLIDIISTYSSVLKLHFTQFRKDAIQLQSLSRQTAVTNLKLGKILIGIIQLK
jgi:hypothetical protein